MYETAWRVRVEPKWGTRSLGSIEAPEVQDWVSELIESGLSAQTIRRAVFVLAGVLEVARAKRMVLTNVARGLELPKKNRKPHHYLTHTQVDLLAAKALHPEVIYLLAYEGPRWGEMVALKVRHLQFPRKRILITDNLVRIDGAYVLGTTKADESREVPMLDFVAQKLRALCDGKGQDAYVFGDGVTPLSYPHATSGWFAKAVKAAQAEDETFPRITPHDLRHTAASLAVSAGANVTAVQRMLGHASAAITLDVYADLFDSDLDAVAQRMEAARILALAA